MGKQGPQGVAGPMGPRGESSSMNFEIGETFRANLSSSDLGKLKIVEVTVDGVTRQFLSLN